MLCVGLYSGNWLFSSHFIYPVITTLKSQRNGLVIEPILVLNLVWARSSWLGIGTEPPADRSPNRCHIVWMRRSAHCRPKSEENQWEMRIYSTKRKRPNIPKFTINIKTYFTQFGKQNVRRCKPNLTTLITGQYRNKLHHVIFHLGTRRWKHDARRGMFSKQQTKLA